MNILLYIDLIISTMFFGKILKQGERYQFNAQNADEFQGEVLCITNAVLTPSSKESASLYIKQDSQEFIIATLTKQSPQISLNIFISLLDELEIFVKGNASVHISGFFQPEQDEDYEEMEEEDLMKDTPKTISGKAQTVNITETKSSASQKQLENQVSTKIIDSKIQSPQQKPQSPPQKPQSPQSPPQKPQSPQQKPKSVEAKITVVSPKTKQIFEQVLPQQESDSEDFVLDQREENIDDSIDEEESLKKKQKKDNSHNKPAIIEQKNQQKGLKIKNFDEKKNHQPQVKVDNHEKKQQNVTIPPNTQHLSKKQLKKLKKQMKNKLHQ